MTLFKNIFESEYLLNLIPPSQSFIFFLGSICRSSILNTNATNTKEILGIGIDKEIYLK